MNFFLTAQYERVFNVNFGAGLRNLLFEQITEESIATVRSTIQVGLENYFPQIIVNSIKLTPLPDSNTISFELKYSVRETNITDEITINFEQ